MYCRIKALTGEIRLFFREVLFFCSVLEKDFMAELLNKNRADSIFVIARDGGSML